MFYWAHVGGIGFTNGTWWFWHVLGDRSNSGQHQILASFVRNFQVYGFYKLGKISKLKLKLYPSIWNVYPSLKCLDYFGQISLTQKLSIDSSTPIVLQKGRSQTNDVVRQVGLLGWAKGWRAEIWLLYLPIVWLISSRLWYWGSYSNMFRLTFLCTFVPVPAIASRATSLTGFQRTRPQARGDLFPY